MEGVDARVFGVLHPAVVDAAAGDDGDVAVLADEKVVVHHVLQAAHAQHHRDMGSTLIIKEKVMTHGRQLAKSDFTVDLNGEDCHTNVISRSVARDQSKQIFLARCGRWSPPP